MLLTSLSDLRDVVYMHCVILLRKAPHPIPQKLARLHTVRVEHVHLALNGSECTCVRMLRRSLDFRTQHVQYMHVPGITTVFLCRERDANNSCLAHCSPCIQAITSSVSHVATGLYTLAPLSILSLFLVSYVACSAASVNSFCKLLGLWAG